MGDMGDIFRAMKEQRRALRAEHGIKCPGCKKARPKAHPTIMLPQQKCRVCGYRDPRPRLADEKDRN